MRAPPPLAVPASPGLDLGLGPDFGLEEAADPGERPGPAPRRAGAARLPWLIGGALALAVPLAGQALLDRQVGRLEALLSRQAGVPCAIDSVEAGLIGNLRVRGVRLGEMFAAEALEASMSWGSLLSGALVADEVRVVAPRLALSVDASGESDLGRALSRLASARHRPPGPPGSPGRAAGKAPRRIVVSEGELALTIAGVASLRAQGVELVPQHGGVRAITGRIEISAVSPRAQLGLELTSAAADLRLPRMSVERLIAVGGRGALALGEGDRRTEVSLSGLSLARLRPEAPLVAKLTLDDHGIPRPLEVQLTAGAAPAVQLTSAHLPLWPLAAVAPAWLDPSAAHFAGQLAVARGEHRSGGSGSSGDASAPAAESGFGLSIAGSLTRARVHHPVVASEPVELTVELDAAARISAASLAALWSPPSSPISSPISSSALASAQGQGAPASLRLPGLALPGAPVATGGGAPFDLHVTGSFRSGAAAGTASLLAHRGAALSATVELTLEPAPCAELLASVPRAMRAPLEGLTLSGELGGALRITVDTSAALGEGADLVIDSGEPAGRCRVLAEPPAADVTSLLELREHTFPDGSRAVVGPGVGSWTQLRQLPAHVDGAFVAAEDARFLAHDGFDVAQIARSLEIDLREGRLARGGSTISQQLVKNAFLDGKRSAARKLSEAVLTWRLEARLSKREILERYLNIIELGPSIFGLAAAAQHWFGVSPGQLTVRQAAFLAALTPEPTTMTRRIRAAGALDRASAARVETVLRAMKRHGLIDQADLELARRAELGFRGAALRAPTQPQQQTPPASQLPTTKTAAR